MSRKICKCSLPCAKNKNFCCFFCSINKGHGILCNPIKIKTIFQNKINIFILCYNEELLLPHTINFYKTNIPNASIIIYDNESTDNSVNIAKNLGCEVISFSTNKTQSEMMQIKIKNNCWKCVKEGWVIVCDMDEFLDVKESDLINEEKKGTTILKIKGYDMIGESTKIDFSDISLNNINKYVINNMESKKLCFYRPHIKEINYRGGAHSCNPKGIIKVSDTTYINKHMNLLGIEYIENKNKLRFNNSIHMREYGHCWNYCKDSNKVINNYKKQLNKSNIINN